MTIYYIVSLLVLVLSFFLFPESLVISSQSLVPIGCMALSLFQAILFKAGENEAGDHTSETAYSTHDIDYEASKRSMRYHALTKLAILPLLCIFILYFPGVVKTAGSLILYFFSYLPVGFLVKYGRNE